MDNNDEIRENEQGSNSSKTGGNVGSGLSEDRGLGSASHPPTDPAATSGETGGIGGPTGTADDIGRAGTGSAMTGQTSILNDAAD